MPPIQVRTCWSLQALAISIASAKPETRGGLMLMISRSRIAVALPEMHGGLRVAQRMDAFVQADRRLELGRDFAMQHDVVVEERLLDEQQLEIVERLQIGPGVERVGRIRVDLEQNIRIRLPQCRRRRSVESWPDLHLQPLVAKPDRLLSARQHIVDRIAADADAHRKLSRAAAPEPPERLLLLLRFDIPEGGFHAALGEPGALDPLVAGAQIVDRADRADLLLALEHGRNHERFQ